jgi:hypothetical protein
MIPTLIVAAVVPRESVRAPAAVVSAPTSRAAVTESTAARFHHPRFISSSAVEGLDT